ncbi:hybrid sensor histidine kinase/response regulator [Methylobacterium radiotolerans]|uniref:hybrid sensor histidine kinase/response regulator n=1 Tax=Methylobacterium radiotolerans TaxID=31998 RepID=UPI00399D4542
MSADASLSSRGMATAAIQAFDWSTTPLGPREEWPVALNTIYETMMASPFAMCAGWGPDLTLLYNEAYVDFLAARHPSALGQPISQVWHDVWDDIHPLIARAMAGEPVHRTDMHLVMTRKGHPEDTYWTFAYSPLRDGPEVVGFLDIAFETTAGVLAGQRRDAAEVSLRDFNTALEEQVAARTRERDSIWRISPDLLVVINSEGYFDAFNPAWTTVLGWNDDELHGTPFADFVHPDDQAATQVVWLDAIERGIPAVRFENRYRHKDGTWRWLSWVGVPDSGKVYGSARDITQDRAQTAILNERTEALRLFRDIVQSDRSPILAFDHSHRVIAFNQAHEEDFRRVMGLQQRVGDVLPDLFPPEQAAGLRSLMDRALAGERFLIVQAFGDPGREVPTWEITYTPLRNAAGQVTGAFHHARDVSERARAQSELAVTQEALRQSQKLEAVGQLTGGVAHDFNNLLTVIKSSTDLLKRPNLTEERRTRYIGAISDTVDRAAKLTGQLLAFARRQALKPETFDTSMSVRALADMMGTLTGSRIQITAHLPAEPCWVNADPSQFDTALVNMAVNARDAMDGEGRITITVAAVEQIPPIRTHPEQDAPYVAVSLADNGSGIAPEQLERIFEPFFTTKETGKGTGLGLSQVFGFAKQSGGDITVDSMLGEGTMFTLYLPRVAAPMQAVVHEEPDALVDGHGTRVLVVEDNTEVGTFAVQTLSDLGYVTVLAVDGPAALAELAKGANKFDVVFSDVLMPGMSGVELGQEIRRLYHDLPVVLTSGYSHILAQNGTYGFELLHKPYSIEQLSQILRKAATSQRRKRTKRN